jgi:restriction system protein
VYGKGTAMNTNFSIAIFKSCLPMIKFLLAALALVIVIHLIFRYLEKQRLAKLGIDDIDRLSGRDFEKYLEVLFERRGYKVKLTKYIGDYGADLVVDSGSDKIVIQAKRFKSKVGVKAVQEAVASKGYYGCQSAMVVTNSSFTEQAKILARANNVELWDRNKLINALSSIDNMDALPHKYEPIGATALQNLCTTCGKPVSDKVFKYCMTNKSRFRGKVYCFNCQKKV